MELKGLVVAAVCSVLATLARFGSDSLDEALCAQFLVMPVGYALGAIAGRARANRTLIVAASALGCLYLLQLIGVVLFVHASLAWLYPACLVAAIAIAMWTRPPPVTLPRARWIGSWMVPRPRWRPPTVVELAVGLWVASAFVIALGATALARELDLHPVRWSEPFAMVDGRDPLATFGMFATIAMPLGVLAGAALQHARSTRIAWRLVSNLIIAAVCAGHGWMFAGLLGPFELPVWSPAVIAIATVVLVLASRWCTQPRVIPPA